MLHMWDSQGLNSFTAAGILSVSSDGYSFVAEATSTARIIVNDPTPGVSCYLIVLIEIALDGYFAADVLMWMFRFTFTEIFTDFISLRNLYTATSIV